MCKLLAIYGKTKKWCCKAESLLFPFLALTPSPFWHMSVFMTVIAVSPLWIFVEEFFRQGHSSVSKAIYCREGMLTEMKVMQSRSRQSAMCSSKPK